MTTPRPPRRRQRTRFLLLGAVAGLAVIVLGAEALLRAAPLEDRSDELRVVEVPPLAAIEITTCARRAGEDSAADIRELLPAGGRVSAAQVYACPAAYDGLRVTYAGEPVGELLPRRGGVWAQVNDDDYALEVGPISGHRELRGFNSGLSVWLPDGLHEQIGAVGRPSRRGDVLLLTGVLYRADPDDGGGITLRADQLEVLAPAIEVAAPLHRVQAVVAALLVALAALTILWARAARQR
jgi:hypothetical protein